MTLIPDPLQALMGYLKADTDVIAQVGTRVYGVELEHNEVNNQPRKCVVVRHAGGGTGPGDDSYLSVGTMRFDLFCYGAAPYETHQVRRAVYAAMKNLSRSVKNSTLLHDAIRSGGATDLRLAETDWPVCVESWLVMTSEVAVT